MRFMYLGKDGGKESSVTGFWLIEIKSLFSIVFLKFNPGSREAFHTHAFNAFSWYIKGDAEERFLDGRTRRWKGLCFPKYTNRNDFHQVWANKPTYCISIRGPWINKWKEFLIKENKTVTLTHGRKEII